METSTLTPKTQITIKLKQADKEIILRASRTLGLGHSSFCRSVALERARKIMKDNE